MSVAALFNGMSSVTQHHLTEKVKIAHGILRDKSRVQDPVQDLVDALKETENFNPYMEELFKGEKDTILKLWADKLRTLASTPEIKRIMRSTLHQNGSTFNPVNLMCLFIFGLIKIGTDTNQLKFSAWIDKKDTKENSYVHSFLSFIRRSDEDQQMLIYGGNWTVEDLNNNTTYTIQDELFINAGGYEGMGRKTILDSIPVENPWLNLKESLEREYTITSDPAFWYIHSFYDMKDKALMCVGVDYKGNNYIFARNLPYTFNKSEDTESLKKRYVIDPFNAYEKVMNAPWKLATALVSKVPENHPALVYVHVMIAAKYHPTKKMFVCMKHGPPVEVLQEALWAGATLTEYKSKLEHIGDSLRAVTLAKPQIEEEVLIRLALAHYALMVESKLDFDVSDDGRVQYRPTFSSEGCDVSDQWLFSELLYNNAKWHSKLYELDTAKKSLNDLSALRRILRYLPNNIQEYLHKKYFKSVQIGDKVGENQYIVFDFQQHALHKKLFGTSSNLVDYCTKQYEVLSNKYFGSGTFKPANCIGKVIVEDVGTGAQNIKDYSEIDVMDAPKNYTVFQKNDVCPICEEKYGDYENAVSMHLQGHYQKIKSPLASVDGARPSGGQPMFPVLVSETKPDVVPDPVEKNVDNKLPPLPTGTSRIQNMIKADVEEDKRMAGAVGSLGHDIEVLNERMREKHEQKVRKLQDKIKSLEARITELQNDNTTANGLVVDLQNENARLMKEADKMQEQLLALRQKVSETTGSTDQLRKEKEALEKEIDTLAAQKMAVNKELEGLAERLRNKIKDNKTEQTIEIIQKQVEEMIEHEVEVSELLPLLKKKEYTKFRLMIQEKEPKKEEHSLSALFLMYESIAATWSLFEKYTPEQVTPLMAQKLIHHIHLYDTITHRDLPYTSHYLKKFTEKLKRPDVQSFDSEAFSGYAETKAPGQEGAAAEESIISGVPEPAV
jgi:chaperonin cofactor prefoldin